MKVVVAGSSKTGTKSMCAALRHLGMKVYDGMEHYTYHRNDWLKICTKGGDIEDFRQMYKGVDAVADLPAWYFWEEFSKAFPESKIILTVRDDENVWCESTKKQLSTFFSPFMIVLRLLSPTFRDFLYFCAVVGAPAYKQPPKWSFGVMTLNDMLLKKMYRTLSVYAKTKAPKDRFLVFNVKEGWEPLCKFLQVAVPSTPFPHKNIRGGIIEEYLKTNPTFIRMQREMIFSIGLLSIGFTYGCYKLYRTFN